MVNGLTGGEIVLWATVFGLLIGVIWSLKYIVIIDRRIERLEEHMDSILHKMGIRRGSARSKKRRR
ncbi:MAG TPA: hypothetical protein VJ110_01650 [Candidatus Nanoarchaeia archaeon]|nr:hypothetical protein [Candidatus Nanoarchaeia archaeon]